MKREVREVKKVKRVTKRLRKEVIKTLDIIQAIWLFWVGTTIGTIDRPFNEITSWFVLTVILTVLATGSFLIKVRYVDMFEE